MLVNLLLFDIIDPKNVTLFIRDQLQGVIASRPTSPPPLQKLILLSIFLNDIQLNNYVLYFETLHLFNVHILLWLNTECTVWSTISACKCSTIWSWMNKVAFLGPIISKSNRFTSLSMPDLDSTAKNNSKISDLNLVGVLSLNFCPSQSLLLCCNLVLTRYPP